MRRIVLLPALLLLAACGGSSPSGFGDGGSPDGGAPDGTVPDDGGFKPQDSGSDGGGCAIRCSSDLHSVIDCNDAVVKTCPANEGCAPDGTCVPACQSADLNRTTIGCDYFTQVPETTTQYNWHGNCYAVYVANTWGSPVTLGIERDGMTLNVASAARIPQGNGQSIVYNPLPGGQLPAGEVAIVFLSASASPPISACPVTPALVADAALHGTGKGKAFHITASAPVVAYDIYPYGGGNSAITSATLLLPTSTWDTNYVAVEAYKTVPSSWSLPWLTMVAREDGTTVTISPTAAITAGGGLAGTAQGVPATYAMNRGEYVQFVQSAEITGSAIQSNKPIGVFGGNTCMNVPTTTTACDGAHQQGFPVKVLGSEYVGVRHPNRNATNETPPWRVVGAVKGTVLTWDPPIPGAPATIDDGQLAEFTAAGPFVVKSQDAQHPFYVAQYMTGCSLYTGSGGCKGDPEFVNVVPALQFLDKYTFFTDPTYPETNLVVVRKKAKDGTFKPVTLDCAGALSGWQPVGSSGNYEYAYVGLVTGNFQKVGACDNGRHEISSPAPFGTTVWGWGSSASTGFSSQAVSYGYPAGMSVQPINTVVVPPTPK